MPTLLTFHDSSHYFAPANGLANVLNETRIDSHKAVAFEGRIESSEKMLACDACLA
jgi:hypothetical protein